MLKTFVLCLIVTLAWGGHSLSAEETGADAAQSAPPMASIGALEFGPGNTLFAADSQGAAIYAIEVSPPDAGSGAFTAIADLDTKLAALLGAGVRDIKVEDMTVHQPSGTFYLSLTRGRGEQAQPVLIQIARDGKISVVDLASTKHSRLAIADAPAADAKLYHWDSRTLTITDLEFIDGELYIAGLSNEEFASTLRRTPYPFDGELKSTHLEIYHGAHGVYETEAPIFSFIPYEIDGEMQLLAGYLCTPLVTFPLDEVRGKTKLRGKTIAELGWGNIPIDMVPYEAAGEAYLLIINSRRGNMRIPAADIVAAQKRPGITTEVGPRTGVEDQTISLGAIAQAAEFDADHVALLGRSITTGALSLGTIAKIGLTEAAI